MNKNRTTIINAAIHCGSVLLGWLKIYPNHFCFELVKESYDIRFNCCNATRPMLNKAQEAAANSGNKTTRSLVSAICVYNILNIFLFDYYYTSFMGLVLKT